METEARQLICPHCGKLISVPAELETFSCVYCGEKLSLDQCLPMAEAKPDAADLAYVEAHLFDGIRNYPKYYRNFTRKKYESSFRSYETGIEETVRALDRCACAAPLQRDALLDRFAEAFVQQWDSYHNTGASPSAAEKQMFYNKMTLVWYTVPAIRDLGLSVSEDFAQRLTDAYNRRYPDSPFTAAAYEDLRSGFHRGMCYITTAVCASEGKPDDCAELTAFRAFRDGWLARTPHGKDLIETYYDTAPAIVQAIRLSACPEEIYSRLRRTYLEPCYAALQNARPELCCSVYQKMVRSLQTRFDLEEDERKIPS